MEDLSIIPENSSAAINSPQIVFESVDASPEGIEIETILSLYKGPLPQALDFVEYEKAVPGSGKMIIQMATDNLKHSQDLEKSITRYHFTNVTLGQIFSLVITLAFVSAGTYLLLNDKDIQGLVTMFLYPGYMIFTNYQTKRELNAAKNNKYQDGAELPQSTQ